MGSIIDTGTTDDNPEANMVRTTTSVEYTPLPDPIFDSRVFAIFCIFAIVPIFRALFKFFFARFFFLHNLRASSPLKS